MGERIVCGCEECHPELYDEEAIRAYYDALEARAGAGEE